MTALPAFGAALSIQYEFVARSGVTPIPNGVGTFAGFGIAPAIDKDGNVVFTGGGVDQGGIYTFISGLHQKVADTNTLMPGGGGAVFTDFSGSERIDIDGGRVAFKAYNSAYDLGLFSNVGQATSNTLVNIAMIDDSEWSVGGDPWVDGNIVAMYGNRLIPTQHYTTLLWDGSDLSTSFVDPGTGYNIAFDTQASTSGDAIIFARFSSSSYEMAISSGGTFEVLAVSNSTPMPGLDGVLMEEFYSFPVTDRDGQDAAFLSYGSQKQGLFKRVNGGALENVADNTTVIPNSGGDVFKSIAESSISLANGQVVLLGYGQSGLDGIYTDIGGELSVVVDDVSNNTITVAGETVQISNFDLSTKSFAYTPQGYQIVFRANIQSGGYAIIKATIGGSPTTEPDISVSGSGTFGNVEIGSSSTHTITINNAGDADLVINSLSGLNPPFSISSNGCTGATIAPSDSCAVSVRFKPTSAGNYSDTLAFASNDPDQSILNLSVGGTGTVAPTPDISVSGNGTFGDVEVGSNSTHTVTIQNIGDANLLIGNLFGLATPFTIDPNGCSGTSLAPNASCTIGINFAPDSANTWSDTLVIPSDDPEQPNYTVTFNGTGTPIPVPNIMVSGSGAFGNVEVNTSSTHTITVQNTGNADLTINSIGGLAGVFSIVSNNCGATLAASASCTFDVRFEPNSAISYAATLKITSDDPDQTTVNVGISGAGTAVPIPNISVSGNGTFGDVEVDTSSTHTITISNTGNAELAINSIGGLAGPFSIVPNNCGATLAVNASCTFGVSFSPSSTGNYTDALSISSNDPDQTIVNINLSGSGTAIPVADITVSGTGAFGDVETSNNSTLSISISNVGNADLIIDNLYGLAAPFSRVLDTCSSKTLAPATSCAVNVSFAPTSAGLHNGTLMIPSNDQEQGIISFSVSGTGTNPTTAPEITVSGNGSFGDVESGSNSIHNINVSNAGDADLVIGDLYGLALPFSTGTDSCSGKTLGSGGSCTVSVSFAPTEAGSYTDTLAIPSNDPNQATAYIGFNGSGTAAPEPNIAISGSGAFGDVEVDTSSTQNFTINNTGDAELAINSIGSLAGAFSIVSNNCGATLAASGSCTFGVRFAPTVSGNFSGTLVISSDDPDQINISLAMSGTGTAAPEPNISVSGSGAFGDVESGTSSTHSISVSNTGNANLDIGSLYGLAAPFSISSNNCNGASLSPGGSCTVNVRFTPTLTGIKSDWLYIPSNDPDKPSYGFYMNGTGTAAPVGDPNISVSGSAAFGDAEVDTNSTKTFTMNNTGDAELTITSIGGLATPFSIVSNNCGATLAADTSCTFGVHFAPTSAGNFSDTLVISSNDPDQANIGRAVSGAGIEPPSQGDQVEIKRFDFENGNANGWLLNGAISVDTDVTRGKYSLRHKKSGTSVLNVSTVDFIGVSVKMHLAATSLEQGDDCFAELSTDGGDNWLSVVEVHDGNDDGTFHSGTLSIREADNNANLQLRFRSTGQHKPDYCWGDDVTVMGTPIGGNDSFTVYKDFSDDNTASVSISLSCSSGTVTNNPQMASETTPAVFSIEGAAEGAACMAIEDSVPSGYTADESDCLDGDPLNGFCTIVNDLDNPLPEEVLANEDFEDGNIGSWSVSGDVEIDGILANGNGQYSLRHGIGSISELSVLTTGYSGVSVTMHLAATALKQNGGCYAEVSTNGGATWTTVVEVLKGNDDGTFISNTISPAGADDNADLQLRFRADGNGNGGYCYGDDVVVSGTPNGAN